MDAEVYVYDDKIKPIDRVEFSIFPNEEKKKISAVRDDPNGIDIAELYDNIEPMRGGLIDPRLGPSGADMDCATCGLNSSKCVGHFGHISLAEPIFHIGYLQIVKRVLSCICLRCSKLLVYKNEKDISEMLKNKSGKNLLNEVKNLTKNATHCSKINYGCGTPVSKIKIEINKTYVQILLVAEIAMAPGSFDGVTEDEGMDASKRKLRQILSPAKVYAILAGISDMDCRIMGMDPSKSRPEDMIQQIFTVPPVQVRPSVKADYMQSATMEDDLTHKLADIIKANIRIRKYKETIGEGDALMKYGPDQIQLLQFHGSTYFDNESVSLPKSEQKSKLIKSLSARLKGKEGRIRSNLMGKRVDFSARTVITPDPSLDMNQLGIPITIAKNITFPEIVTPQNIDRLQALVKKGRKRYPGANFVFPISNFKTGKRLLPIDLRYRDGGVDLRIGDVVERHIVSGDYVLLNRQPTLHKLSMMGHKAKILDDPRLNTFRLNPCVTTPYNADFDGDEMNIFCPQSIQTAIELEKMADVKRQIISPALSVPIIGVIQDSLLGAYNMTQPNMRIDYKDAMDMISYTTIDDFSDFKKKKYKGTELFSIIIPKKISTDRGKFILKRGQLDNENGIMNKSMLGSKKPNSMIHLIWDEYGVDDTKDFLDNIQRMINQFNLMNGFSCGIGDIDIKPEIIKKIETLNQTKKLEVKHLITELENNPDLMDDNLFEMSVFSELSSVSEEVSKLIIQNMDKDNNFHIMAIGSGSKGTPSNIGQMGGCIGQTAVEGKRAKKKLNGRVQPYFHQNDDSAEARGFIESSFIEGMNPTEFIFHNMGSREGLIDTAIRTAESGYIQRKLIKTMEDISVNYDGTVRNSNCTILQFTYGDCGIDTTKQYKHTLNSMSISDSEFDKMYKFSKDELKNIDVTEGENEKYIKQLKELRDSMRLSQIKVTLNYKVFNPDYMLPINFMRIIDNTRYEKLESKDKLSAKYILNRLEDIIEYKYTMLASVSKVDLKNSEENIKIKDERVAKTAFRYALHNYLSPKRVLLEYKFNKTQFDTIVEQIINGFNNSVVNPGQMVGILAAQSIGEPVTQLTLNSFHSAGIGARGTANLGVGRVRELLSFSKNIKTPIMEIYLKDQYKKSKDMAYRIASHIKYTAIKDVRDRIDVYYDPNPYKKDGFMEKDNVFNIFHSHNPGKYSCQSEINNLPWLLRLELNREKMMEKDITLLDIKSKFCSFWEKRYQTNKSLKKEDKKIVEKVLQLAILSNSDNDKNPIIHIRFDMINYDFGTIVKFTDAIIDTFKLKGMEGIDDILDVKKERVIVIDKKTNSLNKEEEYVIYTKGVNLVDIRYINGIDLQRTINNDVVNIYEEFGIEAARTALLKEIRKIIDDSKSNYQHLSVLIDVMTSNGNLISVDRHGLNKVDTNPFARASFEKTIDQFINASVFCETDTMNSVSSRIMAGLVIKGGTGSIDLEIDTDMLEKSEYIEQTYLQEKSDIHEITLDPVIKDTIEGDEKEDIFMPF